jgi:S-adenosylmethionine-diacylglycerol 3-amino-3-carboxypropyl transferase
MVRFDKFFEFNNLNEQKNYYLKHWPEKRFRFFLKLAASPEFMNRFLYRGFFAGKKNSTAQYLDERYRSLFLNHLMKKNFFMQFLFLGKIIYFPLEAQEECFLLAKKSTTKICYIHSSITEAMTKNPYDFYHLSDVLSYLSESEAKSILSYTHPDSPMGALVVSRIFMKGPSKLSTPGWKERLDLKSWASERDETGVYDFLIYQKGP